MALIPVSDMNTLKTASELKAVADSADLEHEKIAVAQCVNTAANTGTKIAYYQNRLSDAMKRELKSKGYTVEEAKSLSEGYYISWR